MRSRKKKGKKMPLARHFGSGGLASPDSQYLSLGLQPAINLRRVPEDEVLPDRKIMGMPKIPEIPASKWMTVRQLIEELHKYDKGRNIIVAIPFYGLARRGDIIAGGETTGVYPIVEIVPTELEDGHQVLVFIATEDAPPLDTIGRRR